MKLNNNKFFASQSQPQDEEDWMQTAIEDLRRWDQEYQEKFGRDSSLLPPLNQEKSPCLDPGRRTFKGDVTYSH